MPSRRAKLRLAGVGLLLCFFLLPGRVGADAIAKTRAMAAPAIAEIFVEPAAVKVELEIGGRAASRWRPLLDGGVEQLAPVLPESLRRGLVLEANGVRLDSRLVAVEVRRRVPRDEVSGEPLPGAGDDAERVIFLVHEYPLPERSPSLTVGHPEGDEARFEIGFITYHRDLPVMDFRYLPARGATLDLDRSDPWYSRFRHRNLRRQFDSPLSTYLYLEPYEVRHEIVVRPVDLEEWVDLGLAGRATIPVDAQSELLRRVAEFFTERNTLRVDGRLVTPTLDRIHFLRRTLRQSTVIDPPEEIDTASALLGAIFSYPTSGLPQEASITWDLFNSRIRRVPAAIADPVTGPVPYILAPNAELLEWRNSLRVPVLPPMVVVEPPPAPGPKVLAIFAWIGAVGFGLLVLRSASLALRGQALRPWTMVTALALVAMTTGSFAAARTPEVGAETSQEILSSLLHNVYLAFAFRDESTIYDTLEQSVTGELLTQTYLETQRGLVLANQGGARVNVKEVELIRSESRDLPGELGFVARAIWNVSGSVGHWGHLHTRTNQYQAELTVKPVEGAWRITRLELWSEERL